MPIMMFGKGWRAGVSLGGVFQYLYGYIFLWVNEGVRAGDDRTVPPGTTCGTQPQMSFNVA